MTALTTGVIVQPKVDYAASEDGKRITYKAEVKSEGRMLIAQLLSAPLILLGLGALFFLPIAFLGSSDPAGVRGTLFAAILVCFGGVIVLKAWASGPKIIPVYFDEKGITVGGRTYLLEHVSSVGWREFGNSKNGYGQVYIQYGGEEIPIINAINFVRTEGVYSDVQRFLKRIGHDYSH